jgi:hypothetical protein
LSGSFWEGNTRTESFSEDELPWRDRLAKAAKYANWGIVLDIVSRFPKFVNACRPGGIRFYAPLHQVAFNGAPIEVAEQLIKLGAWRTLRNAKGNRPVDVAKWKNRTELLSILEPALLRQVPPKVLEAIRNHFHSLIRTRVGALVEEHDLRLPQLEPLLEVEPPRMFFWVPDFAGCFGYELVVSGNKARLVSVSSGRGADTQYHVISSAGVKPFDEEP